MIDITAIDYRELDQPEVLDYLFYPRPDFSESPQAGHIEELMIPVDNDHRVGARFHRSGKSDPTILFFHGNGEIVSDYDDIGIVYNDLDINFLPVDYRGYGHSTGFPTITFMMRDCHVVFDFVLKWRKEQGYTGSLVVMGRSLGSASAVELAGHYPDDIDGLIVESGFAAMDGLYARLGISKSIPEKKKKGLSNIDKIAAFKKPTLLIHAEFDHIIPFSAGQDLFNASGAEDKMFLKVHGANHNDIFFRAGEDYLNAVVALIRKTTLTEKEKSAV